MAREIRKNGISNTNIVNKAVNISRLSYFNVENNEKRVAIQLRKEWENDIIEIMIES